MITVDSIQTIANEVSNTKTLKNLEHSITIYVSEHNLIKLNEELYYRYSDKKGDFVPGGDIEIKIDGTLFNIKKNKSDE